MSISQIEARWLIDQYKAIGITDNKCLYTLCSINISTINKQHGVNRIYWAKVLEQVKLLCIEQ